MAVRWCVVKMPFNLCVCVLPVQCYQIRTLDWLWKWLQNSLPRVHGVCVVSEHALLYGFEMWKSLHSLQTCAAPCTTRTVLKIPNADKTSGRVKWCEISWCPSDRINCPIFSCSRIAELGKTKCTNTAFSEPWNLTAPCQLKSSSEDLLICPLAGWGNDILSLHSWCFSHCWL